MYYFRCPSKKSTGNYFPKARLPPLPFLEKNAIARVPSEIQNKQRAYWNDMKLWGHSQCIIWDVHEKNQQEIIFLRRVCVPFRFWQKRNCTRTVGNSKLTEGLSNRYETLAALSMYYLRCPCKKSAGNYFPNARLPPPPFLAKTQLHAYRRKVKINRWLVQTLWNFRDTLNVLF